MRKRNRTHYKAKHTDNPLHWQSYRELRNRVIDEIRKSREKYNKKMSSMIDKSIPPGKWWRIVKSISKLNKNYEPLPPLKSKGKLIFHPVEKATVLNKYFAQVSSINDEPDIPLHGPGPPPQNNDILSEILITENEVYDQLSITDNTKPPGPDGISPRVLKEIATTIKNPLTKFFNLSLRGKKLPDIWKLSQITPVFKNKGSAQEVPNYRPISLTSVLCWIENYLCDRQQKVVIDGFSSNHETVNAGVPQGSVLGPFLFLLYINDICDDLVNNIRLFADDTSLYAIVDNGATNVTQSLTSDLELIDKW
ncbi:uncharacterized protein LOC133193522 [Saccostrea echinata]|uniref:uncharacterized protein LOC133193522 n=1 Tax=Saccostrea echinata TaxID=191078 RepID=UPI002A8115F3|nr:uncharacterized protein LOC133193522 [Saccostrea echinata]